MAVAERGFLLVAVGERQNRDATVAIAALRARGHGLPIALFTDRLGNAARADHVELIRGEPHGARNKPAFLPRTPFAETLFIDNDMVAFGRLEPVFELLSVYDLAAAHAVDHKGREDTAVPEAFYGFDPGVIAYRATAAVLGCLAGWHAALVDGMERDPDDPAFQTEHASLRRALWQHRLAVEVLPPEYNYRSGLAGFLRAKAVLVQASGVPAAAVAEALNRGDGARIFAPFTGAAVAANPWAGFSSGGTGAGFAFGRLG